MFRNYQATKTRKQKILLIEDEKDVRDLLSEELDASGYHVLMAPNGEEGLKAIIEQDPDLVICDRLMPEMTGFELLERLRGFFPQYTEVPFIFLTALADDRDVEGVEHLKPTAYLTKPIDFDVLHRELERALQHK